MKHNVCWWNTQDVTHLFATPFCLNLSWKVKALIWSCVSKDLLNVNILRLMENWSLREDSSKGVFCFSLFLLGKDYFRGKHCAIYSLFVFFFLFFHRDPLQCDCSEVMLRSSVTNHFCLRITSVHMAWIALIEKVASFIFPFLVQVWTLAWQLYRCMKDAYYRKEN